MGKHLPHLWMPSMKDEDFKAIESCSMGKWNGLKGHPCLGTLESVKYCELMFLVRTDAFGEEYRSSSRDKNPGPQPTIFSEPQTMNPPIPFHSKAVSASAGVEIVISKHNVTVFARTFKSAWRLDSIESLSSWLFLERPLQENMFFADGHSSQRGHFPETETTRKIPIWTIPIMSGIKVVGYLAGRQQETPCSCHFLL